MNWLGIVPGFDQPSADFGGHVTSQCCDGVEDLHDYGQRRIL
jgi:hypothetical protein